MDYCPGCLNQMQGVLPMSEWENYMPDGSGYGPPKETRSYLASASCRSCGALILWTVTEPGGKRMPVDVTPSDQGGFIINHRKRENKLIAIHVANVAPDALPGRNRFTSHFQTCPNAAQHRKKR
jgi:hypothetical protein